MAISDPVGVPSVVCRRSRSYLRQIGRLAGLSLAVALSGCVLPNEFQKTGSFEHDSAFGVTAGMTRAQAKMILAERYPQFHFIRSNCFRLDYPNAPNGFYKNAFGDMLCPGNGEDVYHSYSFSKFANIIIVFRGDDVLRVRWNDGESYFG